MSTNFPPCPASLKPIMHYLKVASEHDERNPVIAYWCRLHALQQGIKLSAGKKNKDETTLLVALMDWLEVKKKELAGNEAITNEMCAQAALEEHALKLFKYADEQDRAENYNKNVVKAFYTCGIIMDVLAVFGELSEDIIEKQKYAKWKAAYIHNCLKNGERPVPGPLGGDDNDNNNANEEEDGAYGGPSSSTPVQPNHQPSPPAPVTPAGFTFPDPTDQVNFNPQPYQAVPPTTPVPLSTGEGAPITTGTGVELSPDQISKAQKYCKYAASALNYDDTKTAINNLQRALQLLQTGVDES